MQPLLLILFCVVVLIEFLDRHRWVPHLLTWSPELLSIGALLLLLGSLLQRRQLDLAPAYPLLFILFISSVVAALLLNQVPAGAAFSGLRIYFKQLPLFLLPAVAVLARPALRQQLLLLLALALIQLPIALYQRFILSAGVLSGDAVRGTLLNSSGLSLFLIAVMALVYACYLHQHLSRWLCWTLLLLLFIPCTLNETKGSLLLLPIALLLPALTTPGQRWQQSLHVIAMGALLLAIFVPIYDHFMLPRSGHSIIDFFTMEGRLEGYLAPRLTGTAYAIGRIDALLLPFQLLANDLPRLLLGVGIGNVSESFLGDGFHGAWFAVYGGLIYAAMSNLLWEVGLFGTLLLLLLCLVIARDALHLSRRDDLWGALGRGWVAVTALFVVSLFYRNLLHDNAIWYLYWYFSGVVAAARWRLQPVHYFTGARSSHATPPVPQ